MTINGVKTRLRVFDPDDEAGAVAAAEELVTGRQADRPAGGGETVAAAVGRFERDELPRRRPDTVASYRQRLAWLVRRFGQVRVADLDQRAVEASAAGEAGWSAGTRRLTLTVCQVCLRWAGRDGFKLAKPHTPPRDERFVLTREEFEAIMAECRGDFAPLVQVMFLTGCRPGEARRLTCEMVNWQSGRAVLHEHKTAGKTGRPKSIYLSDAAIAVLRGQRDKYGGGLLFRGVRGQPLSSAAVRWRWRRVRDLLGLRAQVIPYSLRHSFATHLLEGGATSRDVAELLGHTSTAMVEKTYGHFTSIDRLRGVAGRLDGAG